MKVRTRVIAASVVAVAVGGCFYSAYKGLTEVETAENVPQVDWLPSSATNVSYYRSYVWTAYEFDIAEPEFLKWAKDWPVIKITDQAAVIPRYLSYTLPKPQLPATRESESAEEARLREEAAYSSAIAKRISHGYFYQWIASNGGGVTVGYDLDTGRAYYQSSPR